MFVNIVARSRLELETRAYETHVIAIFTIEPWERELDLNQRALAYEANEVTGLLNPAKIF